MAQGKAVKNQKSDSGKKSGKYAAKTGATARMYSDPNHEAPEVNEEVLVIREKRSGPFRSVMGHPITKPESQMTSIEKMETTRIGISKKALEELKAMAGLDYDQLAALLGVARTTLLNKKGAERFAAGLSEKIMSLADLYSYGYEIFGDVEEFNHWIFQPLPALGEQAPYAFLDNQYGREEVRNLIGRIAYGVYS